MTEKQKACSSWPSHLNEPRSCRHLHPTLLPGNQSLCALFPPHSWLPGGSQAAPQSACVMGVPGCLLPPAFIREEVWESELLGRMALGGGAGPRGKGGQWETWTRVYWGGIPSGPELEQEVREEGSRLTHSFISTVTEPWKEELPGGGRKPGKDVKTKSEK